MSSIGKQIAADLYGCRPEQLRDAEFLKAAVQAAVAAVSASLRQCTDHALEPQGLFILALLADSHLTIRTYPELGYAAVDIFSANNPAAPDKMLQALRKQFNPTKIKATSIRRGDFGSVSDMKPQTKTLGSPLRRVKNTSVKMLKFFARSR